MKESKNIIRNNKPNDFGRLLNESWMIKKRLDKSISNSTIDDMYNLALKNGALGGKILGAGGGGFLLFYVNDFKKKYFLDKMKFLTNVPFEFENNGTQIIS